MKMNSADIIIRRYLFIDIKSLKVETHKRHYYYRTKVQQFGETEKEFDKNVLHNTQKQTNLWFTKNALRAISKKSPLCSNKIKNNPYFSRLF